MERPSPQEVAEILASKREEWLPRVYPAGKVRSGVFYLGDADGSPGESMPIPLKPNGKGVRDFGGDFRGDDLALFGRARGHGDDQKAAYLDALDFLGFGERREWDTKRDRRDTRESPPTERERIHFSASWLYTDEAGEPWIEVCRFDPPHGRKQFHQFNVRQKRWTGKDGGTLPEPRPLYNLPAIAASDDRVVFVAGEKCADALIEMGFLATTNLGGELALDKTDLLPLRGRLVVIWHDHDETGRKWRDQLVRTLRKLEALPLLVDVPSGTAEKWDAADAIIDQGWSAEDVRSFLDASRPAPTTLHCISALDFVALQLPPRDPLFGPFLTRQSLVMAFAERGVGKTWVAMNIAYAAATGGFWLKWHAPKPVNVLYLDGEMPAPWFQERWQRIMASPMSKPLDNPMALRVVTPDLQVRAMPDIGSPEGREHIAELLPSTELVVVDNISTLVKSGAENEAESWIPIQEWALDLRRRGIAVLFVHHAGKGGSQRGTSKREDVLDSILSLRRPEGYEPDDGARFEIHFEKARGFAGPDAEPIEAWLEEAEGATNWHWKPIVTNKKEQVLDLHDEGKSVREIAGIAGLPRSTIDRWIRKGRPTAKGDFP